MLCKLSTYIRVRSVVSSRTQKVDELMTTLVNHEAAHYNVIHLITFD
jgi:hypothetical protein